MSEIIRVYDSLEEEKGENGDFLMKITIPLTGIREGGEIAEIEGGNNVVNSASGLSFIVERSVITNIDSIRIDYSKGFPQLVVKEGHTIEYEVDEYEVKKQELLKQLKALEQERENLDPEDTPPVGNNY